MQPGTYITNGRRTVSLKSLALTDSALVELLTGENENRLSVPQAWSRQGWLRRCIKIRAGALASMPWTVRSSRDRVVWDHGDDPPRELAALATFPPMLFLMGAALALEGKSYTLKEQERSRFTSLYWFNPALVKRLQDGRFQRQIPQTSRFEYYDPEDIIAIYAPDPYVEVGPGSADAHAARVNSDVLDSLAHFLDRHLDGGLTKTTILRVPPGTTETERNRLLRFWETRVLGKRNAGKVNVASTDVEPTVIGEGMKDLQNTSLTTEQREAIATALGVPHGLVMSNETGAKATIQEDHLFLYDHTVIPDARVIQNALNEQLFGAMGYTFRFEPHRLDVKQDAEVAKAASIMALVGRPILTINEGRELINRDPVEDGDMLALPQMQAGSPQPQPTGKTLAVLREREIVAYKRKVKAKGPDVDFEPVYLAESEVSVIKSRLLAGEEIDDAFDPPFEGF